ncbi:MAG: EAL domain-containing protein [Gammaproteobacteria bacterium]|nr:EAL domain-containing protein [Gammaproteobacteria bacterium]
MDTSGARDPSGHVTRLSRRELSKALEQTADLVMITDKRGIIEYVNPALEKATGFTLVELIGLTPGLLCSGRHDPKFYRDLWETISSGSAFRGTFTNRCKDGSIYFEEKTITPLTDAIGEITHYVSTGKDVTEHIRKEKELRTLSMAVEQSVNAIIVTDLRGQIEYVNHHFCVISGYDRGEVIGKTPNIIKSDQHPDEFFKQMWETLLAGQIWQDEICNRKKSGELYWEAVSITPVHDEAGCITHFVSVQEDISERREAANKLNLLAYYDSLTNLPNREMLRHQLDQALKVAKRKQENVAVLYTDLDRFKTINDSLGHEEGDKLLCQVGRRFRNILRDEDTVARVGGDEFVMIVPEVNRPASAGRVAAKLLSCLQEPFILGERMHFITASIGIALYPRDHIVAAELLKNADVAMYQAKAKGSGGYQFYSQEMGEQVFERMQLEQSLRIGLSQDEFQNFYQPQFSLTTGELVGCEALMRWRHPVDGLISPAKFIPIAEDTGEIIQLGELALHQACSQMLIWQENGLKVPQVSVNLSPLQLSMPNLPTWIGQLLNEYDLAPNKLVLELTESAMMQNPEQSKRILDQLKSIGVRLALDDFGTGYSSLSYLRRFPFDCLKIDLSFVKDLTHDDRADAVAMAIISMAHDLGMTVVAEGVETQAQRRFLSNARCDGIQGFLTGKPAPAEQTEEWLRRAPILTDKLDEGQRQECPTS